MSRVLFITNYPSPYRVDFWNLLGRDVELTVSFTSSPAAQKHRPEKWFNTNYENFRAVFLSDVVRLGKIEVFRDIIPLIKEGYDHIIVGGYSSPTFMYAIRYMKRHKIHFFIEADGGIIKKEPFYRYLTKKYFLSAASAWLSSGQETTRYFLHYGAKKDKIYEYPFTSLWKKDIDHAIELSETSRDFLRSKPGMMEKCIKTYGDRSREIIEGYAAEDMANVRKDIPQDIWIIRQITRASLGIPETKVTLCVGQFIHRKGIDVLIRAANLLPHSIGIYIVGGEPTPEYVDLRAKFQLSNIHFIGFKEKKQLADYFRSADVLAVPTREDIWGLVVNEGLSFGLPVVSTDKCVAALELVKNGINGFIVPVDDEKALAEGISNALTLPNAAEEAIRSVKGYSLENMAKRHHEVFNEERRTCFE